MSSKLSRNYLLLPLLAAIVLTLSQVSSHDAYASPIWSASGPGNVVVTESDQGINGQAQFKYNINLGGGVPTQTWTFETPATQTGPITLDYDWTGFHAFFRVTTFLNKFDGTGTTNLVSQGPVNCCTSPSGGFHYTGSVTINAVAGQPYGFTLGGSNFDSNSVLSGIFTVKVKDTTPPVVTVPAPITTTATSPSGATVTFTTSATDPDDTAGPVQCNPASGSTFPIGTTTVTCTSTDTHSNTGTASFTVTVQTPQQALQSLITLKENMGLPQGITTSLDAKLNAASDSLSSDKANTAKNQLNAFINEVNAQTGKKITQVQANQLISGAQNIINSVP